MSTTSMHGEVGTRIRDLKFRLVMRPKFTISVGYEVMLLNDELGCFKAILEEASTKFKKETFRNWEKRIREFVQEIDETVKICATPESTTESKPGVEKWLCTIPWSKKTNPAQVVSGLREKTEKLIAEFQYFLNSEVATTTVVDSAGTTTSQQILPELLTTNQVVETTGSSPVTPSTINSITEVSQQLPTTSHTIATDSSSAITHTTISNTPQLQKPHKVHQQSIGVDASVGFLLENLRDLMKYNADLIGGADYELKLLIDELRKFNIILEEASSKTKKDETFKQWEKQVRETVYDMEDTIDICITQASAGKKNLFNKVFNTKGITPASAGKKYRFKKFYAKGIPLAEQVKTLRQNMVRPLMDQFSDIKFSLADGSDTVVDIARETRQQKSHHIVGFKEEAASFVNLLTGESDGLIISSVIGMAGLGKTTFAWKVFEESMIKYEFPVRIWVNISEDLNMKNVLLGILRHFTATRPDESVGDEQLLGEVKGHLEEGKFLIVMDDIWTVDAWKKLKALLPTGNKWGRVLITTRNSSVGHYASTSREHAHDLRFLNRNESWELLQYGVFGSLDNVPQELVANGRNIADDCKGLPLSIIVIGGILEEKTSRSVDNTTAIRKEWEDVSRSVRDYLVGGDRKSLLRSIISLSYDRLPYKLRNCFLYLGIFPEDANIPVKKLIRLWIAEGFVQEIQGMRLEEVAENNLKELINQNLVMVKIAKPNGVAKICQIHASVHAICKIEGIEQNLFQEVNNSIIHGDKETCRRLCIHSQAHDFFSTKPRLLKARSFLNFSESTMTLEDSDISYITDAFASLPLRVYDAIVMKFPIFPLRLVRQLKLLRYLTLAVDTEFSSLPEAVTNLWNLQTLIVETPSRTLDIKGDMLGMRHLRHFSSHASIILKKIREGNGGNNLQTLGRLSPESCTVEVCERATSLVTLGIQGDLRKLGDTKCLAELETLNKLKLVHEVTRGGEADNPLRRLPDSHSFPPKLKILVLIGTRLEWTMMSVFSAIPFLEVLKLKEKAFQGDTWKVEGSGFRDLTCLHIERSDLKCWKANGEQFPRLRVLYINNCEKILEIPSVLGKSLELLSLERVTKEAVECAEKIVKEQEELKRTVRLEIAPADRNRQS